MIRSRFARVSCLIGFLVQSSLAQDGADVSPQKTLESAPEKTKVHVDREQRTVTVEAVACEADVYPQLKGAIEYVLVSKGGKTYEALFETEATPAQIRHALLALRLPPGIPAEDGHLPRGAPFHIRVEYQQDERAQQRPVDEFVLHAKREEALRPASWTFTDSVRSVDPETGRREQQCVVTKSIVGLHFTDSSPLIQNSREEARTENIYKINKKLSLPKGTPVRLVFQEVVPEPLSGVKRVHVYVSGRVQGVGYRDFVQRSALQLALSGVVRNLEDGRVEAVAEGPEAAVDAFLAKLERGPRAARVTRVDAVPIPARGDWTTFEILR